ncbi:hypothetical protein E2C01_078732 [Portunus trituberculatus]|uniref:Endonuclease/exonuclease/phosphatase domain-containing protein n=1 Tax=Portunus trituberculatus TaxID=210409 RepID=A0A5B7IR05_PORTR|nr:hypothetical protein [Portunus trituberculatus]
MLLHVASFLGELGVGASGSKGVYKSGWYLSTGHMDAVPHFAEPSVRVPGGAPVKPFLTSYYFYGVLCDVDGSTQELPRDVCLVTSVEFPGLIYSVVVFPHFGVETLLPSDSNNIIRGYKAFHSARDEGRARGCTILVRDCIPCTQIANPIECGNGVEVVAVTIKLRHLDLTVYNIYNNPASADFDISEVLALCATTHTYVGGDFNAHHKTLGSKHQNRSGHHIVDVMANLPEVTLLHSKEPTHIAGGILDLTFVSETLQHRDVVVGCHQRGVTRAFGHGPQC